jgi:hypothetical protein
MYRLSQYINAVIRISSEVLFEDEVAHDCTLISVEDFGVWLQSPELTKRVYAEHDVEVAEADTPVFVPFAQIAYVIPMVVSIPGARQAVINRSRQPAAVTAPAKNTRRKK